jgi:hypothetical protein
MLLLSDLPNVSTQATGICRAAQPRDGIGMWRLARHAAPGISPFSVVTVLRQLSTTSVVAERDGEIIGFVVARPRERSIEVLDAALAHDLEHPRETLVEMLATLLQLPACRHAAFVDVASTCDHDVRDLLEPLCAAPLAKCGERQASGAAAI